MSTILLRSRFRALLGCTLALALPGLLRAADAKPRTMPLGDNETVALAAPTSGDAALHLTVSLSREHLPAPTPPVATIALLNSSDYVWWSAPVQVSGTECSVDLPPKAAAAILISEKAVLRFAADDKTPPSVVISIPRDRLTAELGGVVPRMHDQPMFFQPPASGQPPKVPDLGVDRAAAELYVTAAEKWDSELQANLYDFDNQLVHARSLWRDLDTAGRLPWKDATKQQLADLYTHVESQRDALARQRETNRARASEFVEQWNAQHAGKEGEREIEANFYNA